MLIKSVQMSEKVIAAINGELAYQASLHSKSRADTIDHGIEGQLVTLSVYARRAEEAWTDSADLNQPLDALRKVAAIAIRALELYGCPQRDT